MSYLFLILTIIFESTAIILMKLSAGFTNKVAAFFAITCYILSFVFLTLSLKNLEAGIANAIWAGSSTILVAVTGVFIFKERLTLLDGFFLLLIVIGIVGISITKQHA